MGSPKGPTGGPTFNDDPQGRMPGFGLPPLPGAPPQGITQPRVTSSHGPVSTPGPIDPLLMYPGQQAPVQAPVQATQPQVTPQMATAAVQPAQPTSQPGFFSQLFSNGDVLTAALRGAAVAAQPRSEGETKTGRFLAGLAEGTMLSSQLQNQREQAARSERAIAVQEGYLQQARDNAVMENKRWFEGAELREIKLLVAKIQLRDAQILQELGAVDKNVALASYFRSQLPAEVQAGLDAGDPEARKKAAALTGKMYLDLEKSIDAGDYIDMPMEYFNQFRDIATPQAQPILDSLVQPGADGRVQVPNWLMKSELISARDTGDAGLTYLQSLQAGITLENAKSAAMEKAFPGIQGLERLNEIQMNPDSITPEEQARIDQALAELARSGAAARSPGSVEAGPPGAAGTEVVDTPNGEIEIYVDDAGEPIIIDLQGVRAYAPVNPEDLKFLELPPETSEPAPEPAPEPREGRSPPTPQPATPRSGLTSGAGRRRLGP